jgi:hypothetical protein
VAVATAGLPYLARGVQRLIESVLALAIVATVVAGQGLPVSVIGSMAIGWGVTAGLHLALGSPAGLPSGKEVRALLAAVGIEPASVVPSPHQTWGAAHYPADMGDGETLAVSFYGRDATDAQLLSKAWRFVFYTAPPRPACSSSTRIWPGPWHRLPCRLGRSVPPRPRSGSCPPNRSKAPWVTCSGPVSTRRST